MISQVDICNLALTHIGKQTIASLDESTEAARKCKLIYPICRDSVLRAASWKFATRIEALAELSDESVIGWTYVYKYPARCLFVRELFNESTKGAEERVEFQELLAPISGQKALATGIEQAYAEFTSSISDTNIFDTLYVHALTYLMGSELAQPLAGDRTMGQDLLAIYNQMIGEARRVNASEGHKKRSATSAYLTAR